MTEHNTAVAAEPETTAYADPMVAAIITALRERYPDITEVQIGEFLAMVDEHAQRLIEARREASPIEIPTFGPCPVHGMTDCSPILNGCTWLTEPEGKVEAHNKSVSKRGGYAVQHFDRARWGILCGGCDWAATRPTKRDAVDAHAEHIEKVRHWGAMVAAIEGSQS